MPRSFPQCRPWMLVLLCLAVVPGADPMKAASLETAKPETDRLEGDALDASRIGWHELQYRASKLFLTAEATLSFERIEPERALVRLGSELMGRSSETRLWLVPASARAIREEKLKVKENQAELRSYTYAQDHALKERYHERAASASSEPIATWSVKGAERQDYPSVTQSPVGSPSGLLYVLAASALDKPGDSIEVTLFTDRRLVKARAEATELANGHDLKLVESQGARLYRPERVLRIALTGRDAAGELVDLGLFGLDGDLEVLLDADRRLPLSIRGSMSVLGKISVRLEQATLAASDP